MLPGPTVIRNCKACGKLIAQHTIVSGNTFGARFWTDGKRDAPMLPDQPLFVKCQHCAALLWIDEQEKAGEVDQLGPRKKKEAKFKDALPFTVPSLQDYLAILAGGVSDNQKERYLRLRAWWAGNDERREGSSAAPLSAEEVANLRVFAALLDESDENDRIMKAEAMRELGRYEEATAILSKPVTDELAQAVGIIKDLVVQKVPFVQEMKFK